jgi:hypothetical protein
MQILHCMVTCPKLALIPFHFVSHMDDKDNDPWRKPPSLLGNETPCQTRMNNAFIY